MRAVKTCFFTRSLVIVTGFAIAAGRADAQLHPTPQPGDSIGIIRVTPDRLSSGGEHVVNISVSYHLETADSAAITVSCNELAADRFDSKTETVVGRGTGIVNLIAHVRPVHWSETQPFQIVARLVTEAASEIPTARQTIYNAEAKEIPKDGLIIIGIYPEILTIDQEQEVSVLVAYNLEQYDEGVLYLGFNTRAPDTYTLYSNLPIARGKGETLLTAKVIPKSWGDESRFFAYVNLSSHNHARTWSPSASDREAIELTEP